MIETIAVATLAVYCVVWLAIEATVWVELAQLFNSESGIPFKDRLKSFYEGATSCGMCLGFWVTLPLGVGVAATSGVFAGVVVWLAVTGGNVFLHQLLDGLYSSE